MSEFSATSRQVGTPVEMTSVSELLRYIAPYLVGEPWYNKKCGPKEEEEKQEGFGPHQVLFCSYLRLLGINVPILCGDDIDNIDYSVFRYSGFADCEGRMVLKS